VALTRTLVVHARASGVGVWVAGLVIQLNINQRREAEQQAAKARAQRGRAKKRGKWR
jgi:hypothetical protein